MVSAQEGERAGENKTAFDSQTVRALARKRLYSQVPAQARDVSLKAAFGDDDLNPQIDAALPVRARPAAVLVALVERQPEVTVLMTRRSDDMPTHAGQVAFPGGKIDKGDDGPVAAALRETAEETGIGPDLIDPVGFLDAYQTRTGFRIVPVVGFVREGFQARPEPGEVAEIFEVPLKFLMDPANHRIETRRWQGQSRRFYAMPFGRHYIWGATAGMLRSLYLRLYADRP